jgi:lipopolysaccharide transport system permease protein
MWRSRVRFCLRRAVTIVRDHLLELYTYRVLIESLVRREVRARYRGSVFGFLWSLINPLLLLIVYRFVFAVVMRTDMPNYVIFLFAGLLPWQWLATSLSNGTTAISGSANLITRVCLPPHVLPVVVVLSNLVNFVLALPVVFIAAAYYGIWPSPALGVLPILIAIEVLFTYGLTLLVATFTVRYRDVQFLVQNLVMLWFFMTPIAYDIALVPERYRSFLVYLNPAMAIIVPYQYAIYGRAVPPAAMLGLGLAWALAVAVAAIHLYERARYDLAEEV